MFAYGSPCWLPISVGQSVRIELTQTQVQGIAFACYRLFVRAGGVRFVVFDLEAGFAFFFAAALRVAQALFAAALLCFAFSIVVPF